MMSLQRQVSRDYDNLRQENAKLREQVTTHCNHYMLGNFERLIIIVA